MPSSDFFVYHYTLVFFMLFRLPLFSCLALTILFLLSGCTDNLKSAIGSAEAFIDNKKGQGIHPDYIQSLPYSSSLMSINDSKPILLILTFAEQKGGNGVYRLTWQASDKNIIVTESGRIVHTTGFSSSNIEGLITTGRDLSLPGTTQNWVAHYDWSPGYRYDFSATVNSETLGIEVIESDLWSQITQRIKEDVTFTTLDYSFLNYFWVAPQTDIHKAYVIKSIQYLGPNMDKVEMLMIKPFIEVLPNTKGTDK